MALTYKCLLGGLFISLIIGIVVFLFCPFYLIEGFDKALEGVLLLSSISLGFYGACLSVLASIFNTKVVQTLMSDNDYKKEFIIVSLATLISSFFTVFTTIFYQVILVNSNISNLMYKITNALWTTSTITFLSFNVIFILVIFLVFFSNTER